VPAGNEIYADSCTALIAELGLTGAATLEGRVDTPVRAYHAGHVIALTSISEGFPYTVVESMACGRAVVCTNVGGVAGAVAEAGVGFAGAAGAEAGDRSGVAPAGAGAGGAGAGGGSGVAA